MRYGVYLPNFGPYGDPRALIDLARDAENAGWDGFFIWDHIADRGIPTPIIDPWIGLAAVAMATERVKIGALVTPTPRRRPWKLARETVSLDHLSGGRLIFSVGIGSGRPTEWHQLGEETDPKTRGAMLDEALELLDRFWHGEPFSFAGEHYRVTDAQFLPTPVQQPRIPVWVAANWPNQRPMRRALRWDGAFPLFSVEGHANVPEFAEAVAFIREHRADDGSPYDIVYRGVSRMDADPAGYAAEVIDLGATWWVEHLVPQEFGGDWAHWPVEAMRERVLQGPPKID